MASSIDDNEADKKSDKETDMNTEPQILMYNFQEEKRTHLIRQYLNRAGIGIRVVQTPEFLESLGYLFGLPGFSRNPQFNMGNKVSKQASQTANKNQLSDYRMGKLYDEMKRTGVTEQQIVERFHVSLANLTERDYKKIMSALKNTDTRAA